MKAPQEDMGDRFLPGTLRALDDAELVDCLWTEGDTLPRSVIDAIVRRGTAVVPLLFGIVRDDVYWRLNDSPRLWAVTHASYALGAIGGEAVAQPFIAVLRNAIAAENDWVTEEIASMFGAVGPAALEPLRRIATDLTYSWSVRARALDCMAAITIEWPNFRSDVFECIASVVADPHEDHTLRGLACSPLLDFRMRKYRRALESFLADDEARKRQDPSHVMHFDREWMERELSLDEPRFDDYARDWLKFYDPKHIARRQQRWKREGAWWYRIARRTGIMRVFGYCGGFSFGRWTGNCVLRETPSARNHHENPSIFAHIRHRSHRRER